MTIASVLDDAAAAATAGLRIDLPAARAMAARRRAETRRRRASLAMLSAAAVTAVVALVGVLGPGAGPLSVAPAPATAPGPVGLPEHWYRAPLWAPPVTRHPMAAASMVLSAPIDAGSGIVLEGPVLVSADARTYATLPSWHVGDGQVALSADGRFVAWATPRATNRLTVHRIELSTGEQRDLEFAGVTQALQLLWAGRDLYLVAEVPQAAACSAGCAGATFRLPPGTGAGEPARLCGCAPALAVDGAGRLLQAGSARLGAVAVLPGVPLSRALVPASDPPAGQPAGSLVETRREVLDPAGERTAAVQQTTTAAGRAFTLLINDGASTTVRIPVTGSAPITGAQALAWGTGGVVLRVRSESRGGLRSDDVSLRLYRPSADPTGWTSSIIARRAAGFVLPVAIADGVVGAGTPVPAAAPSFPGTDRAHLRFLANRLWSIYRDQLVVLAVATSLALAGLVVIRRRRRAARPRT